MSGGSGRAARVATVTSLGRNGLQDWLVQRVGGIVLLAYTLFIVVFLLRHPQLSYAEWHSLFATPSFRLFSALALLALASHAWIGLWAVTTDYLTTRLLGPRATALRLLAQGAALTAIFAYLGIGALAIFR